MWNFETAPLARALQTEQAENAPMEKHWYGKNQCLQILEELTSEHRLSVQSGDLLLLNDTILVTERNSPGGEHVEFRHILNFNGIVQLANSLPELPYRSGSDTNTCL